MYILTQLSGDGCKLAVFRVDGLWMMIDWLDINKLFF